MNKQLTELIEYINRIEIPISHTSTQESHAHTIKRQILAKAKSLQSEDGWISVVKELPKEEQIVLMYEEPNIIYGHYGRLNRYSKQKLQFLGSNLDWDGGSLPVKPTHWQPLPNKPKQ